MKSLDH